MPKPTRDQLLTLWLAVKDLHYAIASIDARYEVETGARALKESLSDETFADVQLQEMADFLSYGEGELSIIAIREYIKEGIRDE